MRKLRNAPLGNGIVTLMPRSLFRGKNSATLWNAHHLDAWVHSFLGHKPISGASWMKRDVIDRLNYELGTWSKNTTMNILARGQDRD